MNTAIFALGWLSLTVLWWVISHSVTRLLYIEVSPIQPEDLPIPLFRTIYHSVPWLRKVVRSRRPDWLHTICACFCKCQYKCMPNLMPRRACFPCSKNTRACCHKVCIASAYNCPLFCALNANREHCWPYILTRLAWHGWVCALCFMFWVYFFCHLNSCLPTLERGGERQKDRERERERERERDAFYLFTNLLNSDRIWAKISNFQKIVIICLFKHNKKNKEQHKKN